MVMTQVSEIEKRNGGKKGTFSLLLRDHALADRAQLAITRADSLLRFTREKGTINRFTADTSLRARPRAARAPSSIACACASRAKMAPPADSSRDDALAEGSRGTLGSDRAHARRFREAPGCATRLSESLRATAGMKIAAGANVTSSSTIASHASRLAASRSSGRSGAISIGCASRPRPITSASTAHSHHPGHSRPIGMSNSQKKRAIHGCARAEERVGHVPAVELREREQIEAGDEQSRPPRNRERRERDRPMRTDECSAQRQQKRIAEQQLPIRRDDRPDARAARRRARSCRCARARTAGSESRRPFPRMVRRRRCRTACADRTAANAAG